MNSRLLEAAVSKALHSGPCPARPALLESELGGWQRTDNLLSMPFEQKQPSALAGSVDTGPALDQPNRFQRTDVKITVTIRHAILAPALHPLFCRSQLPTRGFHTVRQRSLPNEARRPSIQSRSDAG